MNHAFGTIRKTAFSASILALAISAQAQGQIERDGDMQNKHYKSSDRMEHRSTAAMDRYHSDRKEWQQMQDKVILASRVMDADVTDGLNEVGDVRDLVLSEDLNEVEHILYAVSYPYGFYGSEDGFVNYDAVAFDRGVGFDMQARIDEEGSTQTPDQLKLTRREADHRLLSNIIGEEVVFSREKDRAKKVEDVLLNRKTGEVEGYVVQMDDDSLFNSQPRAIPADDVGIDRKGALTTNVSFASVEEKQKYSPEFLK